MENSAQAYSADPVRAKRFAERAHAGQLYGKDLPYTVHLEGVVTVLTRFGFTDPVLICAAWLHDIIEDTRHSYNDIKKEFGLDVAEIVYLVTDEKGRNREERHAKTYPLIAHNRDAKLIKLADRIANVEMGYAEGGLRSMYVKEYPGFKRVLYSAGQYESMWQYLDVLLADEE